MEMGLDPARGPERNPGPELARGEVRARIAALRAGLSGGAPDPGPVMPLGAVPVDAHLPGGGLRLGPPHEIAPAEPGDGAAALGFALALCARRLAQSPGEALIAAAPGQSLPHGHGLPALGLDPGRLLLLEAGGDGEVFRALEAALHARALKVLVGLVGDGLPLKPGRRLHLAAQGAGEGTDPPLLLVLRPARADLPNGAATRWRIAAAPAARDRFGCFDGPRWRVRLERCRNGRGGTWLLEWDHAAHRLRLPEPLAGDAAAAGGPRP